MPRNNVVVLCIGPEPFPFAEATVKFVVLWAYVCDMHEEEEEEEKADSLLPFISAEMLLVNVLCGFGGLELTDDEATLRPLFRILPVLR